MLLCVMNGELIERRRRIKHHNFQKLQKASAKAKGWPTITEILEYTEDFIMGLVKYLIDKAMAATGLNKVKEVVDKIKSTCLTVKETV